MSYNYGMEEIDILTINFTKKEFCVLRSSAVLLSGVSHHAGVKAHVLLGSSFYYVLIVNLTNEWVVFLVPLKARLLI